MKKDYLGMALVGVLFLATLTTGVMCYVYLKESRAVRAAQVQIAQINRNKQVLQSLAMDLNQYAGRNPSIIPLLEQVNLRGRVATNAPAAPGGKQ
jgi:hypothetical protein